MLNKLKSIRNNEDGFTLIELLIVIVIIGILAAIAIPIFLNQQKAAVDATVKSDVRNTVSNVALAAVTKPSGPYATVAGDASPNVLLVTTTGNTIVVSDGTNAGEYKVTGSNPAGNFNGTTTAGQKSFVFDSTSGQYTTVTK